MNSLRLAAVAVILAVSSWGAEVVLVRQIQEKPTRWTTQATIDQSVDKVRRRLAAIGIQAGTVADTAVNPAVLADCRVAVLPYNPDLPAEAAAALAGFVKGGGKLVCFYHVDAALLPLLGLKSLTYRSGDDLPKLARIAFVPGVLPGAPATLHQASWNINEPVVLAGKTGAKVAGKWVDTADQNTGLAAVTTHPNGIYFSHIYLDEDVEAGGKFLLAALGTCLPNLWQRAVEAQLAQVATFSEIHGLPELGQAVAAAGRREAEQAFSLANRRNDEARRLLAAGKPTEALPVAQAAIAAANDAFLASRPSRSGELRGAWIHSAYGVADWGWDRTVKVLADNGFNALFVNLCWGAVADYNSEVLPVHPDVATKGDQMEACLAACRKYGIALHVWKVNWNMGHRTPKAIKDQMIADGRTQVDLAGKPSPFLAPHIEANFALERDAMLEIVRKYPVAGIHFDYIRYPGADCDFSDSAKAAFSKWLGQEVPDWPKSCASGGALRKKYNEWRRGNISRLVETVSTEAHRIRPDIQVSAAVFGAWDSTRESIAQDTVSWLRHGWLDFVCPMDYTTSNEGLERLLRLQEPLTPPGIPLYVGLGSWQHDSPVRTAEQIEIVRRMGGDGFVCFAHNQRFAEETLPALAKGITREAAPEVAPEAVLPAVLTISNPGEDLGGAFRVGEPLVFTLTLAGDASRFEPSVQVLVDGYPRNLGDRLRLKVRRRELRVELRPLEAGAYRLEVSGTWFGTERRAQARPFQFRSRNLDVLSPEAAEAMLAKQRPPVFANNGGIRVAVWQDDSYGGAPILDQLAQTPGLDAAPLWNLKRESLAACQVVVLCQPRARQELFKDEEVAKELARFVDRGGGLLTTHALVGVRDFLPPVPSVATGGARLPGSTWMAAGYHAITQGLDRREIFEATFPDRIGVVPGDRGRVVLRTPEDVPVLVAGVAGKGHYVACGLGLGIGKGDQDVPLTPAEATVLVGAVRWLGRE